MDYGLSMVGGGGGVLCTDKNIKPRSLVRTVMAFGMAYGS
jgi:hypothetical protein